MDQLDTVIFDAIIKLRNNKEQPDENSIVTLISKDCKSLSKKQLEERLMTLTKESKIINRPSVGKNSYFTVSDDNTDDLSIIAGLLTIESVKEILKETENSIAKIKETFKREIEILKKDRNFRAPFKARSFTF